MQTLRNKHGTCDDIRLEAQGIAIGFDPSLGILNHLAVTDHAHIIAPLHHAPWAGTHDIIPNDAPNDAAPHLRALGGDFFCAPFGIAQGDVPLHGWPPNSSWHVRDTTENRLVAVLGKTVQGAVLTKTLALRDCHPFVYQEHHFAGGTGQIPASNHANLSLPSGGIIRTSPKTHWETPNDALEPDPARGRSALRYPARSSDPTDFPGQNGPVDITRYPWGPHHEDLAIGIEAAGHTLGWTAVTRPAERDLFVSLRNPQHAPMTVLWHSNGGRDYAPWSGRHFGCLGIEEAAAEHLCAMTPPADLVARGTVDLDKNATMRHVIGAIHWPSGEPVKNIETTDAGLRITAESGTQREVPFDTAFLELVAT